MPVNDRWSPYPDSMLDTPRDVSFFAIDPGYGHVLDSYAEMYGVKRFSCTLPEAPPIVEVVHPLVSDFVPGVECTGCGFRKLSSWNGQCGRVREIDPECKLHGLYSQPGEVQLEQADETAHEVHCHV